MFQCGANPEFCRVSQGRVRKGRGQEVELVGSKEGSAERRGASERNHPRQTLHLRVGGWNSSHTFKTFSGFQYRLEPEQVCELLLLLSQEGMDLQTAGCLELAPFLLFVVVLLRARSKHPFSSSI